MHIRLPGAERPERDDRLLENHRWANAVLAEGMLPDEPFDTVLQLGMGGSILGARIWAEAAGLSRFLTCDQPQSLTSVIQQLSDTSLIVVASRSGSTVEVRQMMEQVRRRCSGARWLGLTNDERSPIAGTLLTWGGTLGVATDGPGGRYSVLQPANLVGPACAGLALSELAQVQGNRSLATGLGQQAASQNCRIAVLWNYTGRWQALHPWWNQLVAESLGQPGYGVVPLAERAPHAQHSVGQLLLDGNLSSCNLFLIPADTEEEGVQLARREARASALALYHSGQQVVWIECEDNLGELGNLLLLLMDFVASWGLTAGIDPFVQPGVERIKTLLGAPSLKDTFLDTFVEV